MKDQSRTKQVLIQELVTLRKRIAELEQLESDRTLTETEQQHVEGLGGDSFTSSKILVGGINVAWNSEQGTCTFEDLPVAMMWVDSTLAGLMSGVQTMVGTERFFLALQSEGRKSVEDDWKIISNYPDFHQGFKAIANIAAVAGWGYWELTSYNSERRECRFSIKNSWEGHYQKSLGECWGSGMLAGKMAGYCSRLFGTNCWADQTKFIAKGDEYDEFVVKPSPRLIENEIDDLLASDEATRADMAVALRKLEKEITERQQAEAAIRESETKLQAIFNTVGTGILIIEKDAQIIIEANQTAIEMTGLPKERIIGQICHSLVCPAQIGKCPVKDLGQSVAHSERKLIHADGQQRDILKTVYPITIKGKDCYVESFIDITDRKRAEDEKRGLEVRLNRAEKMEALGTLAGGVAHDLNNVLGVIAGYSELLLYDVDTSSPLRPGLENILSGSRKAAAIVQDLLTLARRGISDRKVLNLNRIIVDCQHSPEFEKLFSYYPSVTIQAKLDPALLNISGSAVHLGKAFLSLVSNAREAMPNGGTLTIETSNQYLDRPIQGYDEVREGDYVVLSVSDTGEGIQTADLKRIFEPFYTKKVMGRSGTGLGLAVVWGTVKDHQGYIDVQSEEGKGSTFTLYFPVTREKISTEPVRVPISEYLGKGETILIVDDVKGQRDLAEEMLKKLNYNVTSASSGEEAVAYLKEHKADLLVLDMIMDPGMDGLETYRRILEIHPQQKAIIVSGFSESDRVTAAQALGAGAYVEKPYVIEKLGLAVRKELDRTT